jgi:hypothetical protein
MADEEGVSDSEDIVNEFENTPEGELKEQLQNENLSDSEADYQQGFQNYPEQPVRDSITKFNRFIIGVMDPKRIVRAANFVFRAEKANSLICLNIADYLDLWDNRIVSRYFRNKVVNISSVSMGWKGFLMTNMMTQKRIVERSTPKPIPSVKGYAQPQQKQGA